MSGWIIPDTQSRRSDPCRLGRSAKPAVSLLGLNLGLVAAFENKEGRQLKTAACSDDAAVFKHRDNLRLFEVC